MPAASISRARSRSSAMCVLQIGQSTNRRNCRWTRRLGSGSLIGSPVTDSRVVAGTISPGLNFMRLILLIIVHSVGRRKGVRNHFHLLASVGGGSRLCGSTEAEYVAPAARHQLHYPSGSLSSSHWSMNV